MLRLLGNPKCLCNGTTRRDLLQIGGLGAFGLALHNLPGSTQAQAAKADARPKFGQAKSCILIYKYGSPPQHETSLQLELRCSLLQRFDGARRDLDAIGKITTFSQQQQTAFSLLTSGRMSEALDFAREPAIVREAYGMTLFGQSCLAARRLVEAGSKFVTVIWDAYGLNAGSWDTHHNHDGRLKEFLLPVFDQTFSALILDLEQRGMLDETLVLVLSEHGRTPQIDSKPVGAGRDHWSRAYSQVYAGGGMGRGLVVGRTDKHAGDVEENPVSPKDVLATAFYLLGIDPESTFPDPEGRPLPITGTGRFRPELLGG